MTDEIRRYHVDDPNDAPDRRLGAFHTINPFLPTSLTQYVIPPVENSLRAAIQYYWHSAYLQGVAAQRQQQQQLQQQQQQQRLQQHPQLPPQDSPHHQLHQLEQPPTLPQSHRHHQHEQRLQPHHHHHHHQLHQLQDLQRLQHNNHHHLDQQHRQLQQQQRLQQHQATTIASTTTPDSLQTATTTGSPDSQQTATATGSPDSQQTATATPDSQQRDDDDNHSHHHHDHHNHHNEQQREHIKKPLNPFMIFMQKQRPTIVRQGIMKESAAINQELGKQWRKLTREEQEPYYKMAEREKLLHAERYPGWSARDNYANQRKRKKLKLKAISLNGPDQTDKKCRARYGLGNMALWCKPCKRKKRCIYSTARIRRDNS